MPTSRTPVITRLSGDSSVSVTGTTPEIASAKWPGSAILSGAEPLSPPCHTARPVYAAAPSSG
jgi:hypothetical protein